MMRRIRTLGWILLCILVCLAVGVAMLAVLPAWDGMGDMSLLDAIFYVIKNGPVES